jgi:general secretion pathway protein C
MSSTTSYINLIRSQFAAHKRLINSGLVLLFSAYLIIFAAKLTWKIYPDTEQPNQSSISINNSANHNTKPIQVNLANLKRLHLFGEIEQQIEKPEKEAVSDAPETGLQLVLTGVVASSNQDNGAAIIEHQNRQNTYGISEKIDGTSAILRQVFADRVIISNNGTNETLMLDGVDYNQRNLLSAKTSEMAPSQPKQTRARIKETARNVSLSQQSKDIVTDIYTNSASITDYINFSPANKEGRLVGYAIRPGNQPELFKEAGFKSGDVIVNINGLDMGDPEQALNATNELRQTSQIEMILDRNGEQISMSIALP